MSYLNGTGGEYIPDSYAEDGLGTMIMAQSKTDLSQAVAKATATVPVTDSTRMSMSPASSGPSVWELTGLSAAQWRELIRDYGPALPAGYSVAKETATDHGVEEMIDYWAEQLIKQNPSLKGNKSAILSAILADIEAQKKKRKMLMLAGGAVALVAIGKIAKVF